MCQCCSTVYPDINVVGPCGSPCLTFHMLLNTVLQNLDELIEQLTVAKAVGVDRLTERSVWAASMDDSVLALFQRIADAKDRGISTAIIFSYAHYPLNEAFDVSQVIPFLFTQTLPDVIGEHAYQIGDDIPPLPELVVGTTVMCGGRGYNNHVLADTIDPWPITVVVVEKTISTMTTEIEYTLTEMD